MTIKFMKLEVGAKLPCYALEHDAGMDVFSLEKVSIAPGERALIRTGIASEIEPGYVALGWDKSGISNKRGLKILGGVIDAGYRGEWLVGLHNFGSETQYFEPGDKLIQVLVQRIEYAEIVEVTKLSESERGDGAFGSTGI
jgi:dUTP pyrophosphatase